MDWDSAFCRVQAGLPTTLMMSGMNFINCLLHSISKVTVLCNIAGGGAHVLQWLGPCAIALLAADSIPPSFETSSCRIHEKRYTYDNDRWILRPSTQWWMRLGRIVTDWLISWRFCGQTQHHSMVLLNYPRWFDNGIELRRKRAVWCRHEYKVDCCKAFTWFFLLQGIF